MDNTFVIGMSINNMSYIDVNETDGIVNGIVVMIIDKDAEEDVISYYNAMNKLVKQKNRVIAIVANNVDKNILALISTALINRGIYDIYLVDSIVELSYHYIEALLSRESSENEMRTFIKPNMSSIDAFIDMINQVNYSLSSEIFDLEELRKIFNFKKDILVDAVQSIETLKSCIGDYLNKTADENTKKIIKELNDKLAERENTVAELKKDMLELEKDLMEEKKESKQLIENSREAEKKLSKTKKKLEEAEEQNTKLRDKLKQAESKLKILEESSVGGKPIINSYSEVYTNLTTCKVKSIIYFKEVSYVRYLNNFINNLIKIMKTLKKLKVKLVIYDIRNSFVTVYRGNGDENNVLIDSVFYSNNSDAVVNNLDRIVVAEPNQAIIEDIIKADYDVVIIYDRMKQPNDVVKGNNVYKYWVMNSRHELEALGSTFKIDEKMIISRDGIFERGIGIPEIPNYSSMSSSKRMSVWMETSCGGIKPIEAVFNKAHINELK